MKSRRVGIAVIAMLFSFAPECLAGAGVRYHVDSTAMPGGTGLDWPRAFNDLQDALAAATPGDEIWVAAGVYRPTASSDRTVSFELVSGVSILGGFDGDETDLADRPDPKTNPTRLSGNINVTANPLDDSYHVVSARNLDMPPTLDGIIIEKGNADGSGVTLDNTGGGIFCRNSAIVLRCCLVRDCLAINTGAGISILEGPSGTSAFEATTFRDNTAAVLGGGLYSTSATSITDCVFEGNAADGAGASAGGGAWLSGAFSHVIERTQFENNAAVSTGGFSAGGALWTSPSANTNAVLVENCAFFDNQSGRGGAIGADRTDLSVVNSTLANNTATGLFGGAIYHASGGSLHVGNSILHANTDINPPGAQSRQLFPDASVAVSIDYSIVEGWDATLGGAGSFDADPMLDSDRITLLPGSPAIDAGWNVLVSLLGVTDLVGNARFRDDPGTPDTGPDPSPDVDIGASEFQGSSAAGCNPADLSEGFGVLDFNDVLAFLTAFGAMDPAGDLSEPSGVFDFNDVLAFLVAFGAGCP